MRLQVLVDDSLAWRRERCALVTELRHGAGGLGSGGASWTRLQQGLPDLVLLDLLMPGLDGFEVTRRMRLLSSERWLPVLATSSLHGQPHCRYALKNGADAGLTRPVNLALLGAKLRHCGRALGLQSRRSNLARRQRDRLDNLLDPVWTWGAAGGIEALNRSALTLADIAGRPVASGAGCADGPGAAGPAVSPWMPAAAQRRAPEPIDGRRARPDPARG